MDPLERSTDLDALGKAWEAKNSKLTVIDAEELASKLKSKVIGQDDVIDHICRTLKRRFAARRPNKPLAVFCSRVRPASAKPTSPR